MSIAAEIQRGMELASQRIGVAVQKELDDLRRVYGVTPDRINVSVDTAYYPTIGGEPHSVSKASVNMVLAIRTYEPL